MNVVNLSQGSDSWLAWRRDGITGTDASVLVGRSPHKTFWRLWAEKSGYCQEVNLSNNPIVRHGLQNEAKARKSYEDAHNEMLLPLCAEWDDDPLFRASFDGIRLDDVPVELKCPHETTWGHVTRFGINSEPFRLYEPQVQHQMLVTGTDHGILVFWYEGNKREFVIQRDQNMIDEILARGHELMTMVKNNTPPQKDAEKDIFIPDEAQLRDWNYHSLEYRHRQARIDVLQAELDSLKGEQILHKEALSNMMGIYRRADCSGVLVTRYVQKGRVNYDKILKSLDWDGDTAKYQDPPTEKIRVTLTDSAVPKDVIEPDVIALLEDIPLRTQNDFF